MSKALMSVLTGRFFSSMAQFSIGPFLVVYLNHNVGLSLSDSVLGVGSLTLASRFVAYPLGLVIDRLGAILLLRLSLFICSVAMAVLAANTMTLSPPWLFVILAVYVAGISGLLLTYRTVVIGLVKKAELTPSFSYVSVAFNLGMLAGPAVGAYFADENDYGKVFAFCAMLYALALLFMLKPTGNSPEKPSAALSGTTTENNGSTPLQETKHIRAGYFITYYCLILQTTSLVTMLVPYISHLSRSAKPVTTFFGVQALLVVGLLLVMARFLKHVSPKALTRLYAFSTSLVSIALLVMGLCNEENMTVSLCIAGSLVAISQSIGVPSGNAILVSLASDQKYGKMFGTAAWVEGSAILSSFILGAYLYPRLLNDGEPGTFWLAIALFTLFVLTATSVIRMAHSRKSGVSQSSRL